MQPETFDLRTHIRNEKTGQLLKAQPYRLHYINDKKLYERPAGSGNVFYESGEKAGRFVKGKHEDSEPHIAYTAPVSDDKKINAVIADKDAEIAALKKQLAEREVAQIEKEYDDEELEALTQPEKQETKPGVRGR